MNAEARQVHSLLSQGCERGGLPPGWTVEKAWPWQDHTHLVAPERKGGVVVRWREISVQLPGHGPARATVQILDDGEWKYKGRGWRERLVNAAVRAAKAYHCHFAGPTAGPISNIAATTYVNWSDLP